MQGIIISGLISIPVFLQLDVGTYASMKQHIAFGGSWAQGGLVPLPCAWLNPVGAILLGCNAGGAILDSIYEWGHPVLWQSDFFAVIVFFLAGTLHWSWLLYILLRIPDVTRKQRWIGVANILLILGIPLSGFFYFLNHPVQVL